MGISLVLTILLIYAATSSPRLFTELDMDSPSLSEECAEAAALGCNFEQWKVKFHVNYPTEESDTLHHLQYCKNCLFIHKNNASFTMQEREDAAMTEEEISKFRGLNRIRRPQIDPDTESKIQSSLENVKLTTSLPTQLSYKNYNGRNYLTPIKNQGGCGSCWAFAATAQYESYLKLSGHDFALADEATLECTTLYAPNNRVSDCRGGLPQDAMIYLAKVGNPLQSQYPYTAGNYGSQQGFPSTAGICQQKHRIFLGNGTVNFYYSGLNPTQIKTFLFLNGPVAVGLYANTAFSFYSSGVFSGCPSDANNHINHAVLLYGWDSQGNWLLKNQWGTGWGDQGYMTLNSSLDCGLSSYLGFVSVASKNTDVQFGLNNSSNSNDTNNNQQPFNLNSFGQSARAKYLVIILFLLGWLL